MIDPFDSTHTNGVMAMHVTFDSPTADTTTNLHGRFDLGQIGNAVYYPSNGAKFITFWFTWTLLSIFPIVSRSILMR